MIRNCPTGLGEPCFDKLEAMLAHAMLSIPSTKGFEIGSGFRGTMFPGSQHNDAFVEGVHPVTGEQVLRTVTNWSGGIQGGITNGEDIYFRQVLLCTVHVYPAYARRVGFKPPATISQEQSTARYDGSEGVLAAKGRHDPCVVPRAVPIVETMAAIVIMEWVCGGTRQNSELTGIARCCSRTPGRQRPLCCLL